MDFWFWEIQNEEVLPKVLRSLFLAYFLPDSLAFFILPLSDRIGNGSAESTKRRRLRRGKGVWGKGIAAAADAFPRAKRATLPKIRNF